VNGQGQGQGQGQGTAARSSPTHGAKDKTPATAGATGLVCRFFRKGHCMFGAKCLNLHVKGGGTQPGPEGEDANT
jgi:hypothetical protein